MRTRDPETQKDFKEIALGLTGPGVKSKGALQKAKVCVRLSVEIDIPKFIAAIREYDFKGGREVIRKCPMLPSVCGRVCPQENQCQGSCVLGRKSKPVAIGALERFAADYEVKSKAPDVPVSIEQNGIKTAVIGAGPAGLTAAADLAKLGYDVTILATSNRRRLTYSIPEFRLPKNNPQRLRDKNSASRSLNCS
jgi:glutamate synthase (NADPH/NADH) small chain